eukprot:766209-Hanusia_phi.AAC.6
MAREPLAPQRLPFAWLVQVCLPQDCQLVSGEAAGSGNSVGWSECSDSGRKGTERNNSDARHPHRRLIPPGSKYSP